MAAESYLVTGGCGLQGSHIVEKLLEKYPGAKVTVMARNPDKYRVDGVAYHRGDITVADDIAQALSGSGATIVFHCAGQVTVAREKVADVAVRGINEGGTRQLAEQCARAGVKAFVFTSCASVVQKEPFKDIKFGDETLPLVVESDPTGAYQKSKAEAERIVLSFDDPKGMRTCAVRPAALYGERDIDVTPGLVRNYLQGRTVTRVGDNLNLFSHTYAGNSAVAHLLAAEKLLHSPDGVAGEAFFVTDGVALPFWDFPREVTRAAGDTKPDHEVKYVPRWQAVAVVTAMEWWAWLWGQQPSTTRELVEFTCMNRYYDTSKAKERLGYEPLVDWKDAVRRSVEWFLEREKEQKDSS